MTSSAHTTATVRYQVLTMAVWLVAGLLLATLNAYAGAAGFRGLALGWSIHPGLACIWLFLIAGVIGLREARPASMVVVGCLLLLSTLVEFLGLLRAHTSLLGVLMVLLAEVQVFRNTTSTSLARVVWFTIGSYVQSVFLYNLLLPGQVMHFFKPGWTL